MSQPAIPDLATLEEQLLVLIPERLLETPPDFNVETSLYDCGLDSMAIMQLLLMIEESHGIMLPDADLSRENFNSVRALARLLQKRLAGR